MIGYGYIHNVHAPSTSVLKENPMTKESGTVYNSVWQMYSSELESLPVINIWTREREILILIYICSNLSLSLSLSLLLSYTHMYQRSFSTSVAKVLGQLKLNWAMKMILSPSCYPG